LPPAITADTVADLSVVLTFAEGIVRSLAFSPDGSVIAAAEGDPAASVGTIHLYHAATGLPLRRLEGHESGVWGVTFSPDGRYLASAGRDRTAKVWDWRRGEILKSLDFPNEVVAVAFSPDSRTLAVGGVDEFPGAQLQDAAIWTFAVDSWEPQLKLAEYWNIPDIAFSPDGSLILGGGTSRNARVWSASDGAERYILHHPGQVGSIAVSPDGSTAATALCEASEAGQCTRGAVWLWSLASGKRLESLSDFPTGVSKVAYSSDGSVLFAATPDGTLRAFSTSDYRLLLRETVPPGQYLQNITDMATSADGRYIATGGSGRIDLWRVGG
jgi:WD40 repeat protein